MDTVFSGAIKKKPNGLLENPVAYTKSLLCRIGIGGCFVAGTPVLLAAATVPIDSVQLFDYVAAHATINQPDDPEAYDPYTSAQQRQRDHYELDSINWYEVGFAEVDGTSSCRLALHQDWMTIQGIVEVGQLFELNLPEQGVSGPARVTSIRHLLSPKRPVDDDPEDDFGFQPVTAIFTHLSNDVWTLRFDNGDSLGVTYNHPIYSVTAQDWRLAGELTPGEAVLTKNGTARLTTKAVHHGIELVWNLEVRGWHNFLVGEYGVVVHNNCNRHVKRQYGGVTGRFESPFDHIKRGHTSANRHLPENINKNYFNRKLDNDALLNDLLDDVFGDNRTSPDWKFRDGSNERVLTITIDAGTDPKYQNYLLNGAIGYDKAGTPLTKFAVWVREDSGIGITLENMFPIQ